MKSRGFTLVESAVVLALAAVLALVGATAYAPLVQAAAQAQATATAEQLAQQELIAGSWPAAAQGLPGVTVVTSGPTGAVVTVGAYCATISGTEWQTLSVVKGAC